MARWSASSTGNQVVEAFKDRVAGKTIIITGPSTGAIGAETALSLAAGAPALIILAGRNESKITPVIEEIKSKHPSVAVRYVELDLSSQSSVRAAASTILSLVSKIDILINNGGIMGIPYTVTPDGIESQFAVNYLSHFLLTNLLMPSILKAGPGSRVVNVSSNAYGLGGVRYEDPGFEGGKVYNPWEAYGQSKCALVLFSHALATKLKAHGGFSFSLHPGYIVSNLQAPMMADPALMAEGFARAVAAEAAAGREFVREAPKSLQEGCSATLIAALDPAIEGQSGAYLRDGQVSDAPGEELKSVETQEKLWALSEGLVGENFDW